MMSAHPKGKEHEFWNQMFRSVILTVMYAAASTPAFFAELISHRTGHHVERCFGHIRVRMVATCTLSRPWKDVLGCQQHQDL